MPLLGRERERTALDRLVESARDGYGGALVVHGDPGVGKTALLDDLVERVTTLRIVRTAGVEGEMELPFAAVQQLCAPIMAFGERLPRPQRDALEIAFGLRPGPGAEPVPRRARGARTALRGRPGARPPVRDRRRPVARSRIGAGPRVRGSPPRGRADRDRVRRARDEPTRCGGCPRSTSQPLGHRDSRALLESVLPAPLDDQVLERLIVETGGNPLALVELPHDLASSEIAGGFGVPAAAPVHAGIEQSFERRVAGSAA